LGDYGSNLSYLIGFGHVALSLKINQIFYSLFYKDMVTPPTPFLETELILLGSDQAKRLKIYNKAIKSRVVLGLRMAFLRLKIGG
jgi:hypothetical protein